MKRRIVKIALPVITVLGALLLMYPAVSDYWNQRTSSQAIASYVEYTEDLDDSGYVEMWKAATAFNRKLKDVTAYQLSEEMWTEYLSLLDITGHGIMGYVEVPGVDISLPIYHGTDAAVLQVAVGHLEWSSLPTGGEGTHCVLSGHRGLSSAKLFTDLPKVECGDLFYIRTLNEVLTYEVDQILTVEPNDLSALQIVEGQDLCTLVTCTPYGINSHRLLVRGHRVATTEEKQASMFISSEAIQIEPKIVACVLAVPLLSLFFVLVLRFGNNS